MGTPRVAAVRRFNRYYTKQIGVLAEGLLDSPYSLAEVRVLYELAQRERIAAMELVQELRIDPGYLSRMIRRFIKAGLVRRQSSKLDGRVSELVLTAKGRSTFAPLDARQDAAVENLLDHASEPDQERLIESMAAIERIIGDAPPAVRKPWRLRQHRPGDMGWVIYRHGVLYSREYGYDERFEALVARVCADFIEHLDPERERCWIAERQGAIVGSVFLVKKSTTVAKLRLLYVEPEARGLGIGARLVDECVRFARKAGYRRITLWTQSELVAARNIYEGQGFALVAEKRHDSFSRKGLVAETWELDL